MKKKKVVTEPDAPVIYSELIGWRPGKTKAQIDSDSSTVNYHCG